MASVRLLSSVVLAGGLMCAAVGCDADSGASVSGERSSTSSPTPSSSFSSFGESWKEPASYVYTLTSSEGERSLIGTFRVTVRDGKVAKAVGLDESARGAVERAPEEVPTIKGLLDQLARAHHEGADTAEAEYAPDGHPVRITLDPEENAVDDEESYVISGYKPVPAPAGDQS
ncbi:DUF6174 domain-containing protein [Streptomyces sp. NBC_00576]|uniref:DUF6174 domain-containing protein n=1 Tax=Streptomyces sp. NBC_00576 TaxID=2903665 RepID=UPI002E80CCCE|nr:DUF6174 domain-containing protein [Streptomyces sp. NBC_00576]WUB74721.1 DUF6174 domain-containing protein [Streptomyces sp. NBC_00576]